MNNLVGVGVFFSGCVVGAVVGQQLLKKRYADIAESEIDSMRAYFERASVRKQPDPDNEIIEQELDFRHIPIASVRSSLDNNKYEQAKKNYNLVSQIEDEPVPDVLVEAVIQDVIDQSEPYLIDDIQYAEECDHFAKIGLVYYLDDVLCDENEEMLDDIAHTIGQHAYDLLTRHPVNMWVRNESMSVDYEIIVMNGTFNDITEEESSMRRRKPYEEK